VVTKLLDFIHKHPNLKVVKAFFHYLDRFFRNLVETDKKFGIFGIENHKIIFFSNINNAFDEASFEVYYISVSHKLSILGFSSKISSL
jgi:hypothetical protein